MHTYQTNSGEVTVMSWAEYLTLKTKNMDTCKTEVQLAKEADDYSKQFDLFQERAAEDYFQGAMAEREKMRSMFTKLLRQCRTFPGSDLKFLSEMELAATFKSNGI